MRVCRVRARAMSDRRHVLSGHEHVRKGDLNEFVNSDRKEFLEILTCTRVKDERAEIRTRIGHGNVTIRKGVGMHGNPAKARTGWLACVRFAHAAL